LIWSYSEATLDSTRLLARAALRTAINKVEESYGIVADEYVRRIFHELKGKPFDRQLLDRFAQAVGGDGIICDLGCGPGHVAHYLRSRGANVVGADLSLKMVENARRLNPGIEFFQADMLSLNVEEEAWDSIVAFYSIVNIPRSRLLDTFREMKRTLKPGGNS
jgi:SAM-dependent methyltransferase